MYSNDLAIKVTDLSKCYNIYIKPIDRLKQSILPKVLGFFKKSHRTYYREFWALKDLNLTVKKGETVGIIGRNGSGKSTLLQLICGTLTPTSGSIEAHGRITALLELGSGFNPEFTGRENIFLNGAILGLSQDEIEARFEAIAKFADIGEFIEQPVKFYSSGMTVRLAFAVQAMVDPDILIVDEALAVGDERFQRKCFRRLEELKENGTSILFVSHSASQIIELCDQALLLDTGQRLLLADPVTVTRAYQKMIYADSDEQKYLIQELKKIDQSQKINRPESMHSKNISFPEKKQTSEKIAEVDFYDNSMIPQSTEIYPLKGARIDNIKIFNSKNKEVNNLIFGQEYKFKINGVFLEKRQSIYLAFHIRNMTTFPILGQNYPGIGKFINIIDSDQMFCLTYKIRMNLLPDTYFIGGAVWATTEPICMHRVIDISMFRVMPISENRAFGYVDLTTETPEFKILKKGIDEPK